LLKYKARYRIDYHNTFSPVVITYATIRILLAMAAQYDMIVDVKTAFLNGDLEESVYMEQPEDFVGKGLH
jgi:hypothetical protein